MLNPYPFFIDMKHVWVNVLVKICTHPAVEPLIFQNFDDAVSLGGCLASVFWNIYIYIYLSIVCGL